MTQRVENTVALLSRTPAALDAWLRGLPEAWTAGREGEGTWSAAETVGHMLHVERADWLPRVKRILEFGEAKAFEPVNRAGHLRDEPPPLERLLDEFAEARTSNLTELRALNLQEADLDRRGRHPGLGVVSMSELLATWAVHDLTHLHQISRVMAHQHRDSVGPWSRFLGVLQCDGHSAQR